MSLCDARRIHLYPVGVEPVPRSLMQRCEGRGGLQGGWDPSLPRRIAALAHHGHSSTLDRYVALVDIHHSHQRFEVYRTTPVGTWPVSRYRHREINSLRATATMAIRLMRPLASHVLTEPETQGAVKSLKVHCKHGLIQQVDVALVHNGRIQHVEDAPSRS